MSKIRVVVDINLYKNVQILCQLYMNLLLDDKIIVETIKLSL